jgi:hypothetical protein
VEPMGLPAVGVLAVVTAGRQTCFVPYDLMVTAGHSTVMLTRERVAPLGIAPVCCVCKSTLLWLLGDTDALTLSNASLSQPYPTSLLVQLTCTGRGSGVQHNTAVCQPNSSPGLCMVSVISRLGRPRPCQWSRVSGRRPGLPGLFHIHAGSVALVPLLLLGAMLLHGVLWREATRRRGTQRLSNQGVYNRP